MVPEEAVVNSCQAPMKRGQTMAGIGLGTEGDNSMVVFPTAESAISAWDHDRRGCVADGLHGLPRKRLPKSWRLSSSSSSADAST
jgi:hypothetical protein